MTNGSVQNAYRVHVLPSLETRSIGTVTEIRTYFRQRYSVSSLVDFYIYFRSELRSPNLPIQKTARRFNTTLHKMENCIFPKSEVYTFKTFVSLFFFYICIDFRQFGTVFVNTCNLNEAQNIIDIKNIFLREMNVMSFRNKICNRILLF